MMFGSLVLCIFTKRNNKLFYTNTSNIIVVIYMGVLKDIKKGWEVGRDRVNLRKINRKAHRELDTTMNMLDEELGEDKSQDRFYRQYSEIVTPQLNKIENKYYPHGFLKEEERLSPPGIISEIIAESIPRKRKCSCKPKRKPVKKACRKK